MVFQMTQMKNLKIWFLLSWKIIVAVAFRVNSKYTTWFMQIYVQSDHDLLLVDVPYKKVSGVVTCM